MKKILIAAIVGAIIFYIYQSLAWMSGFHGDFTKYTANQDAIMESLSHNLPEDGMYMLPGVDPAAPDFKEAHHKAMEQGLGKPWAMIVYHAGMEKMGLGMMIVGFLYSLIACLIAGMVIWHGNFLTFGSRFMVAMAFALFALSQGVLDNMNWWSYPWHFVKSEVIDLTLGWGICSVWLAWYLKKQ